MLNFLLIIVGKFVAFISKVLNFGNGSTWPGHIALSLNPNFIKQTVKKNKLKTILIAGTNGKTTTGKLIQTILEKNRKKVFQNTAGANLLNGIASALISNSNIFGKIEKDFAIFEIDENTLPLILKEINNPDFLIILNLFRDQLDRYGEVNTIAKKWSCAVQNLTPSTTLILNADDPQIAYLGEKTKSNILYFGIDPQKNKTEKVQHASDSTYCPNCGKKLVYTSTYFSHLGKWKCENCKFKHQDNVFTNSSFYPLFGLYNEYNTNAAVLLAEQIGIEKQNIDSALREFHPAFGRQEILDINGKKVQIFLSKNPTSLNESLRTINNLGAKTILLVLNERIPDGRDVSWIWDVDFEEYIENFKSIIISGDRAFDMGLRIKYTHGNQKSSRRWRDKNQNYSLKCKIMEGLKDAIKEGLKSIKKNETLCILPTYSAMLEVRKILTGKKIL